MPPPPPPPPPPHVAHDDWMKKSARRTATMDRANFVFMARADSRGWRSEPKACASVACVQAEARVPLVAGLAASFFHEARSCSPAELYAARPASGTLPAQPSYLARYSSHSGTPIFSPLDAAVDFAVFAGLLELAIVLLFCIVSVLLHPIRIAAHRTAKINKVLVNIGVLLQSSAGMLQP